MADPAAAVESRRTLVDKRFAALQAARQPFEPLWRELRDNFMPTRGRFEGETPEQAPKRNRLPNSTPVAAAMTLASGLHAGLTSPARPWQRSAIQDQDLAEFGPVKEWLAIVDQRMMQWYAKSNLYEALPFLYGEYGVFGPMCMLSFEDPRTLVRFEAMTVGQYWLARSDRGEYDTLYRVLRMTVRQIVRRFGEVRLSPQARRLWDNPTQRETVLEVLHAVEPDGMGGWDSCYYERACAQNGGREGLLQRARFAENPIHAAAWETIGLEPYAVTCPGIAAVGDAKALQVDERNKARAIERHHNPPMQGPATLRTAGVSLLPGAMNWVDGVQATGQNGGIRPVHDFTPDIRGLIDNIGRDEQRINSAFYRDLFLMLTLDERNQRATAEEIRAKYDEKVLALGPTLEKANAMLRSLHARVFGIMVRRSQPVWEGRLEGTPILPPPPRELEGQEILPEFISALQQAQRAQALQGIERFAMFAGQMAQFLGRAPEKFDADQALDEYGTALGVPPGIVRDDGEVAAMREAEAGQQRMAQMAAMAPALKQGAEAARTLAETPTGPNEGDNLLAAVGGGLARGVVG